MALTNNYIKVEELTDNLLINGVLEKYDDTSPFMFCKIIDLDYEVRQKLCTIKDLQGNLIKEHDLFRYIVVVKRVTKIRGFKGYYIQLSDIIELIDNETYNKYVYKM